MKTKLITRTLYTAIFTVLVLSCHKRDQLSDASNDSYSATPILPETPYNYPASPNDHAAALGRVLFYDKQLSLNNSVSCASCHQQNKAFCDNLQFSVGLEDLKTRRNSPSIFAREGRMFWDGRADDVSSLVSMPIKNHVEMKFDNLQALSEKLAGSSYYPTLFKKAFGSSHIDSLRIKMALAEFLRNFSFSNNKFRMSEKMSGILSNSEEVGKAIFFGKGRCSNCHHIDGNNQLFDTLGGGGGYGFTDSDFNIGLDVAYADNGRGDISRREADKGKFMVPVLLNIEYTAPYMHDGRFKTLEEVVEHYNSGIKDHPNLEDVLRIPANIDIENITEEQALAQFDTDHDGEIEEEELKSLPPVKLGLTASEKRSLVDFLKTLSDPGIFTDARFSNPFMKK